jgi:hypothetical protein
VDWNAPPNNTGGQQSLDDAIERIIHLMTLMTFTWRETIMKSSVSRFLAVHEEHQTKEREMTKRRLSNPHDVEDNTIFADKIRKGNVSTSIRTNDGRIFVMYNRFSLIRCAKRLNLIYLLDQD